MCVLGLMRGHWLAQADAENTTTTGALVVPTLCDHSVGLSIQYTVRAGCVRLLKPLSTWAWEMA
jgi:hypothetical protein